MRDQRSGDFPTPTVAPPKMPVYNMPTQPPWYPCSIAKSTVGTSKTSAVAMRDSPVRPGWASCYVGGGLLLEDGYTGPFFRGGGGVELEVSPRVALRATAQAASHDGEGGPHHIYLGLDYRW